MGKEFPEMQSGGRGALVEAGCTGIFLALRVKSDTAASSSSSLAHLLKGRNVCVCVIGAICKVHFMHVLLDHAFVSKHFCFRRERKISFKKSPVAT